MIRDLGVLLLCPICKSSVQELPHTGDATAYHCATHGEFKVADAVFAEANNNPRTEALTVSLFFGWWLQPPVRPGKHSARIVALKRIFANVSG